MRRSGSTGWRLASPSPKSVREALNLLGTKKPGDPEYGEVSTCPDHRRLANSYRITMRYPANKPAMARGSIGPTAGR
jgi:hypothetical protein